MERKMSKAHFTTLALSLLQQQAHTSSRILKKGSTL